MVPSARHTQASFAFNLAQSEAGRRPRATRAEREQEKDFAPRFLAAKARVAEMDVQFIALDDPIERTIFEIYAALHLGTEEYNSFETH
ncbi:MAG: hypothetical protein O2895_00890 [Chloroflexi bacterium]|nr:hypothetical protein [Chloroflexota bacterium]